MKRGTIRFATVSTVLGALLLLGGAASAADDAGALVQNAVGALPRVPFRAALKLTPPEGAPRDLSLSHKVVNGNRASLLEVSEPAELSGMKFLFLENAVTGPEQYIKIKSGRTPVKVEGQIRKQPFLESSFYVSDLVEPKLDSFTYAFVGDEELLARKTKKVEATPKNPGEEIYSKTILWIDPVDLLILKRQFFDKDGKVLKVWTVDKVEKVDGIWTMRDQTMTNVQEKATSRLSTPEVKYNVELKDNIFEPRSLAQ